MVDVEAVEAGSEIENEHKLRVVRRQKADALRARGVNPYPNDFRPQNNAADVHRDCGEQDGAALGATPRRYRVAGRIVANRSFGKAAFISIQDQSGRIQVYVKKDVVGADVFDAFQLCDMGDIVGVEGAAFRTKTNELTLEAREFRLLTKALRPLPEKWHGLSDVETRYRKRYVDLIANPAVRDTFVKRTLLLREMRRFLDARGFMEVETPMMHPLAGGAAARPFVTHHNTLDMDLYMRIAPELYLKRLLVGGFERVYEINRNFRNEGISTQHNPEFTMLEFYWAYANYELLIALTEEMFGELAAKVAGKTTVPFRGNEIRLEPPFRRLSIREGIREFAKLPDSVWADAGEAKAAAKARGIEVKPGATHGAVLMEIFERASEPHLVQPTFVVDFPLDVSPLSRKKESDPTLANGTSSLPLVDRFELYVAGMEMANAFSELNDPIDQRGRFEGQMAARAAGDDEAHQLDEDFLEALEIGMPPAGGEGVGIDRLAMLLTNSDSIRDVILFPLMRPQV
ncbi:MAG: lysine--tRNA ligase [Deltaproteobacteria bacterium]|nr:lysine--tRNA ligase [Deltaproteobacteria bacterium]